VIFVERSGIRAIGNNDWISSVLASERHIGHFLHELSERHKASLSNKCPHGVMLEFSSVSASIVIGQMEFLEIASSINTFKICFGIFACDAPAWLDDPVGLDPGWGLTIDSLKCHRSPGSSSLVT
jgi:hypothetical protein